MGKIVGNLIKFIKSCARPELLPKGKDERNRALNVRYIAISFLLIATFFLDANIHMNICTSDGVRCESVQAGQPFLLEVIIDKVQGSVQVPTVCGLDRFVSKRTGTYMSSINGVSTTKYTYQVRIDEPGAYSIGPARLTHQQQELISNVVTVSVDKDVSVGARQQQRSNQQSAELKVFLRLFVDKDRVVVGQKIVGKLRFYYQDSQLNLSQIGLPEIVGFDAKQVGKPISGTKKHNGANYRYAQWEWDMYPTAAGEFIIPAGSADYESPVHDNHFLSGFFMFANSRVDRKRVYSNAVKITVDPLPHFNGKVDAIGTFERFTAQIKPGIAKEGEGMVLSLEIEGKGNVQAIVPPVLMMPSALKYYDSNSAVTDVGDGSDTQRKRFEFIVQGLKPGDWQIPSQSFTYFDCEKRAYKTIQSAPLVVSIMPTSQAYGTTHVDNSHYTDGANVIPVSDVETIAGINITGPWYPVAERNPLPWWIFHILLATPFFYVSYPFAVKRLFLLTTTARAKKRKAFKDARKKIKQCADVRTLYALFNELFSVCFGDSITHESFYKAVESRMVFSGFSQQDCACWNDFCSRIMQAAYGSSGDVQKNELCKSAEEWLNRLEKFL